MTALFKLMGQQCYKAYKPVLNFSGSRAGIEFDRQRNEDKLQQINEELETKVKPRTGDHQYIKEGDVQLHNIAFQIIK